MKEQRSHITVPLPLDYFIQKARTPSKQTPTYLLLHGFGQRAKRLQRQWGHFFDEDVNVIIPNGPFPMPKKVTDEKTQTSYYQIPRAWYFYDNIKDEFLIDYEFPANLLKALLSDLQLASNPLCIMGYSQGGYLAPFVAAKMANTKHVIGVNCRFREDLLPAKLDFRCDAFHARQDSMVDPNKAYESFVKLRKRTKEGEFIYWEEKDHALDLETNNDLENFINKHRALLV